MDISDARRYLRIDQSALIAECCDQPMHQEEIHRAFTHACSKRDQVKIELDQVIAGVSEELRGSKDDNGKPFTGERIAYLLQGDPTVIHKKEELNTYTKEAQLWQGMVSAMEAKRRMLSELTSLILQGMGNSTPVATSKPYMIERRRLSLAREARGGV